METKKIKSTALMVLLLLPVWICLLSAPTHADAAIAKVSSFKGDVLVQSGDSINKLRKTGYALNNGDYIMTKQGEAQVTFNDGAVMKLNPFSKTMIQERDEESGVWIFKTKKAARRVTVYVGKLWYKSGVSNKRSYVQTPTAVCGLRGSDGDFGFDPVKLQTYMNMYTGEAVVVGNVIRGFFDNPGITAAQKSTVYQALARAYEKSEQAKATGNTIEIAKAKVEALQVAKEAAVVLQANPDTAVKNEARAAASTVDASISAANAKISVEEIKEVKDKADKEAGAARKAGDLEKARKAEQAAREADQAGKKAEEASSKAAIASEEAKKAADSLDLEKAQRAADSAKKAADDAKKAEQTVVTTTVAPTTTVPPTTVAPTTVATTVPPETTTSSTTSSTTVESTTTTTSTTTVPSS